MIQFDQPVIILAFSGTVVFMSTQLAIPIAVSIFHIVQKTDLVYSSNIWNPTHKYLVVKIENVQRKFTKREFHI